MASALCASCSSPLVELPQQPATSARRLTSCVTLFAVINWSLVAGCCGSGRRGSRTLTSIGHWFLRPTRLPFRQPPLSSSPPLGLGSYDENAALSIHCD